MELRQLRYFVKAAETLNFSDAAKALNIAQSTLSQQVRQLEDELNVSLFQRNSHSMSLTEAGSELLPIAMRTLHDAETCADRIRDLQQLLTGTLNIGVTYSFSPILTETLIEFMKKYPRVKL
ncbi:MAG: LysR family transcriptional regulator, partial [Prevotella sp.]